MKTKTQQDRLPARTKNGYTVGKFKTDLAAWLLVVPTLVILVFYTILPLIGSVQMSFYQTRGMELQSWLGLKNYQDVINFPSFQRAVQNCFVYCLWSLLIGLMLPVFLAAINCETTVFRGGFRTIGQLPGIMPTIAAYLILSFFFRKDAMGVLNVLFAKIGLGPFQWFNNSKWTILWIIVCMTWKGAGGTVLTYVAAMSSVSPELYEAAALDGASPWRRFWTITWPAIKGQFALLFIMQIIGVFQVLYEPMVLTSGGPNDASISLGLLMYNFAFRDANFARGCAVGVIMSVFLILLSVVYFAIKNKVDKDA